MRKDRKESMSKGTETMNYAACREKCSCVE